MNDTLWLLTEITGRYLSAMRRDEFYPGLWSRLADLPITGSRMKYNKRVHNVILSSLLPYADITVVTVVKYSVLSKSIHHYVKMSDLEIGCNTIEYMWRFQDSASRPTLLVSIAHIGGLDGKTLAINKLFINFHRAMLASCTVWMVGYCL